MLYALSPTTENHSFSVKTLGLTEYAATWQAMKEFTASRNEETQDEIWVLQHFPVFTQGIAGKPEHVLNAHGIPIVKTDRGGQVTYHGPGQIIVYLLLDIRRLRLGVRELVRCMENSVIDLLKEYRIEAIGCTEAPGVYVDQAKIASVGLKIRKNFCYHGIALNIDVDLQPFSYINPCGYPGLRMTRTKDLGISDSLDTLSIKLVHHLKEQLLHRNH